MTLAPQVSRVLVSSSIPGLGAALRNCLPMVDFQETDLRKEQNRSLSSSEVMVADPDHLGPLMYAAKGQIAFVQVGPLSDDGHDERLQRRFQCRAPGRGWTPSRDTWIAPSPSRPSPCAGSPTRASRSSWQSTVLDR